MAILFETGDNEEGFVLDSEPSLFAVTRHGDIELDSTEVWALYKALDKHFVNLTGSERSKVLKLLSEE